MRCIVCVDDRMGMMFCGRRQSRDRILTERVLDQCRGRLLIDPYSLPLFQEEALRRKIFLYAGEDFLEKAGEKDSCFVENRDLSEYENRISELTVYCWNRAYPADLHMNLDLDQWKCISIYEFEGFSHEKITEEKYRKD